MPVWNLTYNGVTQSLADWGISKLRRKRKSAATDTVAFTMENVNVDDATPFPCLIGTVLANAIPALTITRNGAPWFVGIVSKIPRKSSSKAESIDFEIAGPWYWLENTCFQQMWVTTDPSSQVSGQPVSTISTTRGDVIIGQSFNDVKMNSGQVLMEVLIYAQYAFQMLPFPTVVDVNNLPPAPATASPFIIGTLTPDIIVPYAQVRDKTCAEIIKLMMKYSPDAVAWFDYSTSPPTLNIDKRANLQGNTISVLNTDPANPLVSGFNPTEKDDLQVPVVVAKYEQKDTIDGTSYDYCFVDSYPPPPAGVDLGAWRSQPRAWVQTIDLDGGHTTQQQADIKTIARPSDWAYDPNNPGAGAPIVALHWALSHAPQLTRPLANAPNVIGPPNPIYDTANMTVAYISTRIDAADPLNDPDQNPNNITLPNCPELVNELITGHFPPWLQSDLELDTAGVTITVYLQYYGNKATDPATQALFTSNPNNPLDTSMTAATGGVFIVQVHCKVTNADTETYSELTSASASEPPPVGFAQSLYEALAQLHQAGDLTISEDECSDLLPPGCTFNTSDGLPAWQDADMLVLAVDEDIDNGVTRVQFGPPIMLGLAELAELYRANLGRLPAWKLDQRTTGQYTAGSNVIGDRHASDTYTVTPFVNPIAPVFPFGVSTRGDPNTPGAFQAAVSMGTLLKSLIGTDNQTITGLITTPPVPFAAPYWFYYNRGNDFMWLEITFDGAGNISTTVLPPVFIKSWGMGGTFVRSDPPQEYGTGSGPFEAQTLYDANSNVYYKQYIARVPIFLSETISGKVVETQLLSDNLLLDGAFYDGPVHFNSGLTPQSLGIIMPRVYNLATP